MYRNTCSKKQFLVIITTSLILHLVTGHGNTSIGRNFNTRHYAICRRSEPPGQNMNMIYSTQYKIWIQLQNSPLRRMLKKIKLYVSYRRPEEITAKSPICSMYGDWDLPITWQKRLQKPNKSKQHNFPQFMLGWLPGQHSGLMEETFWILK
jgi:hypothetical protein